MKKQKKNKVYQYAPKPGSNLQGAYNSFYIRGSIFFAVAVIVSVIAAVLLVFTPVNKYNLKMLGYKGEDVYFEKDYAYSNFEAVMSLFEDINGEDKPKAFVSLESPNANVTDDVEFLRKLDVSNVWKANNMAMLAEDVYNDISSNCNELEQYYPEDERLTFREEFYKENYSDFADVVNVYSQEMEYRNLAGMHQFHNELRVLYNAYRGIATITSEEEIEAVTAEFLDAASLLKEKYLIGKYDITVEFCEKIFDGDEALEMSMVPNVINVETYQGEKTVNSPYFDYSESKNSFSRESMSVIHLLIISPILGLTSIVVLIVLIASFISDIVRIVSRKHLPKDAASFAAPCVALFIQLLLMLIFLLAKDTNVLSNNKLIPTGFGISIGAYIIPVILIAVAIVMQVVLSIENKKYKALADKEEADIAE